MKWMKWFLVIAVGLAMGLTFTGCGNDDDDPPDNITGTWAATFTLEGETLNQSWTFNQTGQTVTGSYTFGANTWNFTGTYVNGTFSGVDADDWVLGLTFSGDSASGTIAGDGEVWNASLQR